MQTPIEVLWKDGQRGSWCQAIVEYLTQGFTHREDRIHGEGSIVVVKADQIKSMDALNDYVRSLKWCLLIVTANEDGTWQGDRFQHPNSLVWLQTPHKAQHCHRALPWGWTPGCSVEVRSSKFFDWSFAGQITHRRREECVAALKAGAMGSHKNWSLVETSSFGQQEPMNQGDYYRAMAASKVIPCPSGPVTVDSLRVCEALQLGAIPVLDGASPSGPYPEYWYRVFGSGMKCPLVVVRDWSEFPGILELLLRGWPDVGEYASKWWQRYKAGLHAQMMLDLHDLGAM